MKAHAGLEARGSPQHHGKTVAGCSRSRSGSRSRTQVNTPGPAPSSCVQEAPKHWASESWGTGSLPPPEVLVKGAGTVRRVMCPAPPCELGARRPHPPPGERTPQGTRLRSAAPHVAPPQGQTRFCPHRVPGTHSRGAGAVLSPPGSGALQRTRPPRGPHGAASLPCSLWGPGFPGRKKTPPRPDVSASSPNWSWSLIILGVGTRVWEPRGQGAGST